MQCPKQSSRGCPQHKHPSIWPAKIVDCIRRYQRQRATTDTFESQQMNFEPEQTPWFLCRLANIRTSFFVRGRRQGRQPLNPGAGPAPVALPEAFGGNRRLYTAAPPAADPPRVDSCSPPVHDYTCNLQCILRAVFKKHRFLQGFVAFAVSRFHLGDVKKPWVFHGFGSAAGVRNGQLAVLTALVPT